MSLESENLKSAREQYNRLNELYRGQAGLDLASQQAQQSAEQQAVNAAQQAQAAARNAGMSKAQAAAMGAQNVENVYSSALEGSKEQALAKQQSDLAGAKEAVGVAGTEKTPWDYVDKGAQVLGSLATAGKGIKEIF